MSATPLSWNPQTATTLTSAKASERTTYQLNPMGDNIYMAVCIVANANAPGTMNYNVGENLSQADAQAAAQTDWNSGTRP